MDKGLTLQPPTSQAAEVSRTWQGYLDEMASLREQMERGRREIDLMQKENSVTLNEIKTLVARLGNA
jgi:hypothetical protein